MFRLSLTPAPRVLGALLRALLLLLPALASAQATLPAGLTELTRLELALANGQSAVVLTSPTLAGFYMRAGSYVLAEPLSKRLLDADAKRFGQLPDEPTMVRNLQHLALLYQEQGRLDDALPMLSRALVLEERSAGAEHPDVATALSLLAGLQIRRGQYAEAEAHYRRSLAIDLAALGERHPAVAATTGNLGVSLALQRRFAEAEPLLREALLRHERSAGAASADVAQAARNLGVVLTQQGRVADAAGHFAALLALTRSTEPGQLPLLAQDLLHLAGQYAAQGERQSAEPLFKRALLLQRQVLGESDPRVADTLLQLGDLYAHLDLHALATQQYQAARDLLAARPDTAPARLQAIDARLAQSPATGDDRH